MTGREEFINETKWLIGPATSINHATFHKKKKNYDSENVKFHREIKGFHCGAGDHMS